MGIFLFLVIGLGILLISHYVVWAVLVHFFEITGSTRVWLAIGLFFLAISFIGVNFLVHWMENSFTRGMYYMSSAWIGFFVHLFLAMMGLTVLYVLGSYVGWQVYWQSVAIGFIFLAVGVSLWGMYSARHPVIRKQPLAIDGLPESWKGKRIVQLSDVHLGLSNGPDFLQQVVQQTNEQLPDLIVITGDLFDGGDGNLQPFVPLLNQLQASQGIYFITGNHETYLGLNHVREVLAQTKIHELNDEAIDLDGLRLIGISYPERGQTKDMAKMIEHLVHAAQPQILLYHAPTSLEAFSSAGVDAMFSGHTHQGQLFPFGLTTRLVYKGYDRGLSQIGDMQLYVSSGTGTWGPPMKTSGKTEVGVFEVR